MDTIELNRVQARIIGNLQQSFQTDFEMGFVPFMEAMEELEALKDEYYRALESEG